MTLSLTARQRQILALIADGYTTAEIAERLGLSTFTVRNYVERMFERLGVRSRHEAVAVAIRAGLLED